ncbi:hypothetical protein ANN_28045 [Periplaneta americana]|uniref:Endonuclease/exonuclease/phosphatase domain-containing protein n=1 Tax=Periplaneta americana TaxID=6978 RepID=A0ABQ8RV58_PERAM|nr:hypothetical protein ANN_28045 [Periplaneta americana]
MTPDNMFQPYDAVILTETFLTKEWHTENFYSINSLATQGVHGRMKGGLTLLLKARLSPFNIMLKTDNNLTVKTNLCVIICAHFQLDYRQEDIIDELTTALNSIQRKAPVILAGDLNCRIDAEHHKSKAVISFLEEEGLMLINKKEAKTYIGFNGCSTIDLVFSNQEASRQQVLESVVARKHLPMDTTIYVTNAPAKKQERVKIRRELDLTAIEKTDTKEISDTIQKCNIEEAVKIMERCIQDATLKSNRQNRRVQPWFNQECYKARKHTMIALKKALST